MIVVLAIVPPSSRTLAEALRVAALRLAARPTLICAFVVRLSMETFAYAI